MTIDEFLERLSRVDAKWYLHLGRVRTTEVRHCPISAVTGVIADFDEPILAGQRLGLSEKDANAIVAAADSFPHDGCDEVLRWQLFAVCRLW